MVQKRHFVQSMPPTTRSTSGTVFSWHVKVTLSSGGCRWEDHGIGSAAGYRLGGCCDHGTTVGGLINLIFNHGPGRGRFLPHASESRDHPTSLVEAACLSPVQHETLPWSDHRLNPATPQPLPPFYCRVVGFRFCPAHHLSTLILFL